MAGQENFDAERRTPENGADGDKDTTDVFDPDNFTDATLEILNRLKSRVQAGEYGLAHDGSEETEAKPTDRETRENPHVGPWEPQYDFWDVPRD